jgi:hypothetical protein
VIVLSLLKPAGNQTGRKLRCNSHRNALSLLQIQPDAFEAAVFDFEAFYKRVTFLPADPEETKSQVIRLKTEKIDRKLIIGSWPSKVVVFMPICNVMHNRDKATAYARGCIR